MSDNDQRIEELFTLVEANKLDVDKAIEETITLIAAEEEIKKPENQEITYDELTKAKKEDDFRKLLPDMKIPHKIKYAMFGNAVCRSLLVLDVNKMISLFVLKNPKIQLTEIESFLKNPNIAPHIIRGISEKKDWMKSYTIKTLLVMTPKCPQDISMKWIRYLNDPELKKVATSRNVPNILCTAAKKMLAERKK